MKLGVGSYTFTWGVGVPGNLPAQPLSVFDLLEKAATLGVGVVQFCDNLPIVKLSAQELDAFTERAQALRLDIELGARGLNAENLRAHLCLAKRFRSAFVRLVIDSHHGDEPSADEAVARLRPLMPEFVEAGVKLAIENHDRFPARVLEQMVRQLGVAHTGVCLDTVNSLGSLETPEEVVRVLSPYAVNLHVKDFTIRRVDHQMGFVVEGCPAGEGRLDIPWLIEAIRANGHRANAILELWTPPAATLDATLERENAWAIASVARLRKLIKD